MLHRKGVYTVEKFWHECEFKPNIVTDLTLREILNFCIKHTPTNFILDSVLFDCEGIITAKYRRRNSSPFSVLV